MMRTTGEMTTLVDGFDSLEGPAFDRDGNLLFVNWNSTQIMCLTPDGELGELHRTNGLPAGLAFHPDGSLYIADEGDDLHGLLRLTADGRQEILVNEYEGKPLNGANDLVFDRNGVIYFSDPWRSSLENPVGAFYRYFPDGRLEQLDAGLAFPNGVALNARESYVYLAETQRFRILRYPIRDDGSVGAREEWAHLERKGEGPDGMAFDADGYLYVAHYGGGCVAVFNPEGQLVEEIAVPGPAVTNCAFGGPDNRTLVITEVSTGSIYRTRTHVPGQPLNDGRLR
jgi:gluconolactonase